MNKRQKKKRLEREKKEVIGGLSEEKGHYRLEFDIEEVENE